MVLKDRSERKGNEESRSRSDRGEWGRERRAANATENASASAVIDDLKFCTASVGSRINSDQSQANSANKM